MSGASSSPIYEHSPRAHEMSIPVPADVLDAIVDIVVERVRAELLELLPTRVDSPLLSVDEAADLIRAKRQRIYDLLSSGRLTRHKDGSRVLVSREELLRLVALELPRGVRSLNGRGLAR